MEHCLILIQMLCFPSFYFLSSPPPTSITLQPFSFSPPLGLLNPSPVPPTLPSLLNPSSHPSPLPPPLVYLSALPSVVCPSVFISPADAGPQLCGVPVLLPAWAERLYPPGPAAGANERTLPGRHHPLQRRHPQQQQQVWGRRQRDPGHGDHGQ